MGKVKVGHLFCLTADILTKVLQKCSMSSPLPNIFEVMLNELNLIGGLSSRNFEKKKKNRVKLKHCRIV